MQRAFLWLLSGLLPGALGVASDYNYDINYYNDYELFDKGYQYEEHETPPEYVSPYAGSYEDEVRLRDQLVAVPVLAQSALKPGKAWHACRPTYEALMITAQGKLHGVTQMYGDFFEDHEEKTADCRIDKDGAPKFNGAI